MILRSRGSSDVFLVHYDKADKPQWAIKMGSDGEDKGRALAVTMGAVTVEMSRACMSG